MQQEKLSSAIPRFLDGTFTKIRRVNKRTNMAKLDLTVISLE